MPANLLSGKKREVFFVNKQLDSRLLKHALTPKTLFLCRVENDNVFQ